ncbi:MAG: squalene/phytoene synthase family protein [Gemmatimonadetes bacterium]|nr:squalene/phytoene synthase family protein [Gemmatimonadota bacterium]
MSRTFALCIRLLPGGLEHPVAVAYLLCRIADTVEDHPRLSAAEKSSLLAEFRDAVGGEGEVPRLRATFTGSTSDDGILTHGADTALRAFRRLPAEARDRIRPCVQETCDGMAEFARARAAAGALFALPDIAALDRYCYFVAGTVGHLLTGLFTLHSATIDAERRRKLDGLATSFGLGLQLTNIVKDVTVDRERGWSFVPAELCREYGLTPDELTRPEHRDEAMRVMRVLSAKARGHLDDALAYCTSLPRREHGIRMFCLIAVYLAIRTLRLAERDPRLLDREHNLKITRGEVKRTLVTTALVAPSNGLVRAYYGLLARAGT